MNEILEIDAAEKPANLLFVDDEPFVLKALRRVFRGSQYQVTTADSGAEGLQLMNQQTFDLIISDMRMPHMDGAEFLSKALVKSPDTVRILLTGYADIESTIAAVNNGKIFCYCCKPWDDEELKDRVNQALEQKRYKEERARLFEIINSKNQALAELNASLEEKVDKRTAQVKKSLALVDQANNDLKRQYNDSIKVFAKIIETRPGIKSGHAKFLAEFGREVVAKITDDANVIKQVIYAGLLLQLGKLSLPDNLLNTPLYQMNRQQQQQFFDHAVEGYELLMPMEPLRGAAELIYHQYERWDGSGLPLGLAGDQIPLGSRILMVVRDYLEYLEGSLTGDSMSSRQAKELIESQKGTQYDPLIVELFLNVLADQEAKNMEGRPVVEMTWSQLRPGMEAAEVVNNGTVLIKDQVLTERHIDTILNLRRNGNKLVLKIRLGSAAG